MAYVKYNTVQGCSLYPTDVRRHIGKLYQSLYTGNFCVQFMVIVQDPAFTAFGILDLRLLITSLVS